MSISDDFKVDKSELIILEIQLAEVPAVFIMK